MPCVPLSPYAITKVCGEQFCDFYARVHKLSIVCLRFSPVYGPRQRPDLNIHAWTRLLEQDQAIPLIDAQATSDYVYVGDIVRGILAASAYQSEPFQIINLGSGISVNMRMVLGLLATMLHKKIRFEHANVVAQNAPVDYPNAWLDIARAQRLLGYKPQTDIQGGIRQFVDWYTQNRAMLDRAQGGL